MSLTLDTMEGARATQTATGYQIVQTAIVTELSGDRAARLYNAINYPGVPRYGDEHPVVRGVFVRQVEAVPDGPATAKLTITYGVPEFSGNQDVSDSAPPLIEVGASLMSGSTEIDINGQTITASYKSATADEADTDVVEVERQVPRSMLRLSRREPRAPWQKAIQYVGKVNGGTFWGYPEASWLCTEIMGRSDDGGNTYDVQYEFQFGDEDQGWDTSVFWYDSEGKIPEDATVGNGIIRGIKVYKRANFSGLRL